MILQKNKFKSNNSLLKLRRFIRYFFICEICKKRFNPKFHATEYIAYSNKHKHYYKCSKCVIRLN